ncbi:hypothetical protein P3342_007731 [Pyrenophora teres f. teres]|uniref:Secretory lipase family protein n=1 Tax=Pyrenophora teres f. teres TaxID=97479 RepID=A0A6S6W2F8_9PLEO|nr:hypothetical protein PTNB29_02677 [Pyrenophora teres f. teres]KAE8871169.1 hypothetical protein PTNB73_02628 [Pyrenophora teres f. teres]KAK1909560.1 hypothetical protein P3342_007731 [Pyrenophora teres f. teres]CAE7174219.1 Secretory lipase family protein [Pyrenophora teres f. teres]
MSDSVHTLLHTQATPSLRQTTRIKDLMYEAGLLHAADAAEGGMTSWRPNERLAMPNQNSLLGAYKFLSSVANVPALRLFELTIEAIRRTGTGPIGDVIIIFMHQFTACICPDTFRLQDYITETVLARIPVANQGCVQVARALFASFTRTKCSSSIGSSTQMLLRGERRTMS